MKRLQLLCPACARRYDLTDTDAANGFEIRKVKINYTKCPAVHSHSEGGGQRTVTGLKPNKCDNCAVIIKVGEQSVAVTEWLGDEPENWEWEFGGPLPEMPPRPKRELTAKTQAYISDRWSRFTGRKP